MNAPETAVAVASLPLAHITPSPSNPRKHFDEAYLAELAGTIKDHGVLQPITVRPNPRHKVGKPIYEIVVGECRWRAAKIAGLTEIPAFWRELDDRQVLEIQIVENLQRRDVHPLEEAEGYEQLMKRHGYTAEQLAEKIGKSKAYIYARLKLCALDAPARKAFYEGKLNPSTALLIARIPVPALQTEAMKEITAQNFRGEPMSYRGAAEHIQDRYMLRLDEAPFPRTDCAGCPKRTGNQKDLFPDVKSGDVCTDPACFDERKQAHAERLRAEAESRGQQIIEGKSAKKIMPSRHTLPNDGDYVALDATCYDDDKYRSWRKLLGKDAPTPALLVNPHTPGELIEVLPRATIAEHLKAKGIDIAK